jgi:glycine/D-amino acid oxidase-like deaminating enzyme
MNTSAHSDVLVVGGGIIGAAIAYYVSRTGLKVTVLERNEIASGTSSRCDGNILAIDKDPGFDSKMTLVSQNLVHQLSKELEHPFEYRDRGSILVCENEGEMESAEKWVNRQKEAGLPFKMLDRQDIKEESSYFADDLLGGLECKTDSTVNPYLLTYSLFEGAKKHGTELKLKTEVLNISYDKNDQLFRVRTNQGDFISKKVVNAAGVWSPKIGQMLNVNIPIKPRKGHIIVSSRQNPIGLRKVMEFGYLISKFGGKRQVDEETEKFGVALVFEPTESQNFLIGSSREFIGMNTKVDQNIIRCIAKRAIRFYPQMKDMNLIRAYAGLRPWTPDHLPVISHVDKVPGFYIAAGHEGDGISLAAVTGKIISELIEEKETSVPIEPLRYDRFEEGVV